MLAFVTASLKTRRHLFEEVLFEPLSFWCTNLRRDSCCLSIPRAMNVFRTQMQPFFILSDVICSQLVVLPEEEEELSTSEVAVADRVSWNHGCGESPLTCDVFDLAVSVREQRVAQRGRGRVRGGPVGRGGARNGAVRGGGRGSGKGASRGRGRGGRGGRGGKPRKPQTAEDLDKELEDIQKRVRSLFGRFSPLVDTNVFN